MKQGVRKMILLLLVILSVISCGKNTDIQKENIKTINSMGFEEVKNNEEIKNNNIDNENTNINTEITGEEDKIKEEKDINNSFNDKTVDINILEKDFDNIKKYGINGEDLQMIHFEMANAISRYVEKEAIEKKDLKICDKLEENIESCKYNVVKELGDIELCNLLEDEISCKNEIYRSLAQKKLDETICDKIVINDDIQVENEEKYVCIREIVFEKARKNLDLKICNKLNDKEDKNFCIQEVEYEESSINENIDEEIH